jgi:hypothetical protein
MDAHSGTPDAALQRARDKAAKYTGLIEALEKLAHAEEEAADTLLKLDMSVAADEHLERATELYRQAADVAQQAIDVRMRELDLMKEDNGGSLE